MSEGSSKKVKAMVPAMIERVVSAPKFKWHRVSTVRDFLPGYGGVTAPNFRLGRQITVDQSSQENSHRPKLEEEMKMRESVKMQWDYQEERKKEVFSPL
ncbi:hypothetical protein J1N35_011521 [Gossypium stocksii]|uniref:Uncharacterized protein n=1 Tax=Gossypium stocksii TaxID=47602 RepID=A0A9D3W3N4_9ROSI|nr:hypothetical protein J1N35_011521 [Gossypium stocksii]